MQFFITPAWRRQLEAAIAACMLAVSATPSLAQGTGSIRARIVSLANQDLTVSTANGTVKALLTDKTVIRTEVPVKLTEIKPGMYLGTTAAKQADGSFLASDVHIFSEDQRGTGEGHRPLGSDPQSGATMTNANVERVEDVVVNNISGRRINLKYKGGEVTVLVPPDIPIVKRVHADRSALVNGAQVSLQTARGNDGALSVVQVTVRAVAR